MARKKSYLISVDAGAGQTNGAMYVKNSLETVDFASYRKEVKGKSHGTDFELERDIYGWEGRKYVVDDDAIIAGGSLDTIRDIERYGSEFHQFLVAVAIAKLGIKSGDIDLVVYAPPEYLERVQPIIEDNFSQNGGKTTIYSNNGLTKHEFCYRTVTVMPEGVSAIGCFILDDKGNQIADDTLAGEILLLDSGALTLDCLHIVNGKIDPDRTQTYRDLGLYQGLFDKLAVSVASKGGYHFQDIRGEDIESAVRRALNTGEWYVDRAGHRYTGLEALYSAEMTQFTSNVLNRLSTQFSGLAQYRRIIPVSGGSVFLQKVLESDDNLVGRVLDISKSKFACEILPTQVNAVGGLRIQNAKRK